MRRYWWWFRVALFAVIFVGLGVYLFSTTPWRKWVGLAPDYAPLMESGNRVVGAIHRFKAETGLWPQYLEDLVPDYMEAALLEPRPASEGGGRWFYDLGPVPDETAPSGARLLPSLSIRLPESPRAHLGYDFDPREPAWQFFGETEGRRIPQPPAASGSPLPAAEKVRAAALAEIDRRIAREPREIEHRRAKAGLLMSLGSTPELRALVQAAAADFPDSYWPKLATAVLDLTSATALAAPSSPAATAPALPQSVQAFADWVRRRPSLTRWFYLSHLERLAHRPEAAAAAMAAAARQPVEVAADDPHVAAYYLWDMTRWALETKRWALVTELTDAWELAHGERLVADASYLPLRAAARLAQNNLAGAQADLARLDSLPSTPRVPPPARRLWAKNIDTPTGLREAITRGDPAYVYSPGKLPGPFQVFPMPE